MPGPHQKTMFAQQHLASFAGQPYERILPLCGHVSVASVSHQLRARHAHSRGGLRQRRAVPSCLENEANLAGTSVEVQAGKAVEAPRSPEHGIWLNLRMLLKFGSR